MKKIIYLLLILNLGLLSCVDDASVRVMPEFNCKDTKVNLAKAAGSSVTSLLYTNVGQVVAQYQAEWLSVDVNAKSVIYTALTQNDGEDARSTVVKLTCGSYTVEVTVTQDSKEPDLSLKVGQSVDDGIGMIFWVDPSDKMVGKAVSVKRQGGNPFEASVMSHNALSTVNGYANTALFTAPAANDAVAYCQSLGEGWYLPARDELWELFDVYNGIGHADPDFASVVPDKLTEVEKAARAAFDKMLTDLQGDVINEAANCKSSANWKAPFLKYPMCPVKVRAPSGKTTRETPSFNESFACRMVSKTFFGPERSTKICPALSQAFPTNGNLRRLFFIIHLKFLPMKP